MSTTTHNTLPSSTTPKFELFFFDKYNNAITSKTDVSALTVTTDFVVSDVKLCVTNNGLTKLSTVCKSANNDENEEKWKYLTNGDKYKLIVNGSKNDKSLEFPVKVTGGYTDGDSAPIDLSKTFLNPAILTLIAGESQSILLELRTKSDIRKNYWFTELNKHISIKFPDNVNKCQYSIEKAQKPGQYSIIFVCTEKKDAFNPTILVKNAELPKKLSITVNPNVPALSRVFKMTGEEIIESNLGSVSVDDKFQMKTRLYDKYNNLITAVKSYLKSLQIEIKPNENVPAHKSSAQTLEDKDGVIIISLISTYAGKHTVVGVYFPQNYNIQFTHGVPDDNSLLEVSHTERIAGENVKIYITPYDQYNNYIDAIELKDKNPYQTKYTNEGSNNELLMGKYSVEKYNGKNVLSYPGVFYVRGIASIFGYIGGKGLKCVTCRINIKSKDVYFPKSEVLRFVSSKKDFETLKNGAVEKNVEEEPVYRLYPRDQYENIVDVIPQATLLTYKAYLASQNESTVYHLKLNNNQTVNQSYAEFVINDIEGAHVTYKTLVGGYYDLVFTNGKDKLVYNITLLGDGKGGSNEAADIQKTAIVEQNLKYLAGKTGYIIVEIRTKRDIRKNFWDGFNIRVESCDANDKTFNYTQEHGGLLGVFLITVSTEKANTYPKLSKCQLKIYVNNELVKKLSPEQEVSPNAVVRTKILENYYKDGKSSAILKDGTADKNYEFEVASYDKYNNLAQTLQEVVGIKVKYEGKEEISKTNSVTEISTGYRKYVVPATKSGNYVINTEKSESQGLYFNESTFKIHPGAIDLSKTVVNEKLTPIKAGEKPSINIKAFDKYGNALYPDDYIMKFTSIFIDANKISHTSKGQKENEMDVFYSSETPVTIVGNVNVEVTYDKKNKIDTSDADIEVIPAEPYAPNSILLRETSEGVYTKYKNGSSFQIDTKETLSLNVTLYDKYNNLITNIPADSEILKPLMSGNYMEEIIFNVTLIENATYFNLDFNENHEYTHIYQHLVGGTYDLTYTVKTSLGEASFKYNMVIPGGDGKHGNGRYVIGKCVITPNKISFMAGTYGEFSLELRNAQGLLYNDDINTTSDIDIENVEKDPTFVSTVEKADPDYYGVYTIKIYSEKKGDRSIYALLADITIKERTKKRVGPGYYNVYPEKVPDRRFTVFTIPPEPKVNYDSMYEMQFILADRFNNSFERRHDIVDDKYLTLLNNEEPLPYASLTLSPDKQTYKLSVYPKYPPKTMSMNILYNDGEDTVYCFLNNTIVTIMVGIDYSLTQIVSSNKEKIKAGEKLDMWLYTFDKKGECIDDQDYSQDYEIEVTGPMDSTKQSTKKYSVKNIVKKELECNNEYQIITTDDDKYKYAGNYIIKVHAKGLQNPIASYNQVCLPLGYSLNGFSLDYTFDPNKISILDKVSFTVTGTDMYGNKVTDSLIKDLEIYFTKDGQKTKFDSKKSELTSGTLDFNDVAIHLVGPHQLHMTYKGQEVLTVNNGKKLPIFTILVGPCRSSKDNFNFDLKPLKDITTNTKTSFSFQCYDIYNNTITKGGEKFTVISHRNENGILIDVDAEIEDNLDGTYTVKFVPEVEGLYIFNFLIDSEKYGEEIRQELKNKVCEGEDSKLCPNKRICVKDLIDCVEPADKCKQDKTKPFWCPVNGNYTCTKSQVDCDCPKGYIRCNIQKYCVPKDRKDMCATPMLNNNFCKINLGNNYKMFEDGYCRLKNYRMPNQRVCPIGKVLCADLSCRDSYDDCIVSEVRKGTDIRCVGQQLVSNIKDCPNTITCEKENQVVCPDGTCVENEIYCKALTKCNDDKLPYLCQNNNCAADFDSCPPGITCGHKDSLCSDGVCREKC